MIRTFAVLMAVALSGFAICRAAENPVVGKWDCVSSDEGGTEQAWTLVVSEDRGKLSGSLLGTGGQIPLIEPKLEGNLFTFKIYVNPNCTVETRLKIEGKKLSGTFACPEARGTFKGAKQS